MTLVDSRRTFRQALWTEQTVIHLFNLSAHLVIILEVPDVFIQDQKHVPHRTIFVDVRRPWA